MLVGADMPDCKNAWGRSAEKTAKSIGTEDKDPKAETVSCNRHPICVCWEWAIKSLIWSPKQNLNVIKRISHTCKTRIVTPKWVSKTVIEAIGEEISLLWAILCRWSKRELIGRWLKWRLSVVCAHLWFWEGQGSQFCISWIPEIFRA